MGSCHHSEYKVCHVQSAQFCQKRLCQLLWTVYSIKTNRKWDIYLQRSSYYLKCSVGRQTCVLISAWSTIVGCCLQLYCMSTIFLLYYLQFIVTTNKSYLIVVPVSRGK